MSSVALVHDWNKAAARNICAHRLSHQFAHGAFSYGSRTKIFILLATADQDRIMKQEEGEPKPKVAAASKRPTKKKPKDKVRYQA